MPYRYHHYYANVKGWTKVSVSLAAATGSWTDGDVINVGSPVGKAFVFRLSSTLFYDDQYSGTLRSAISPVSSQSFPRQHPKLGTGNYVAGNAGTAFGYYGAESVGLSGTLRDNVPGAGQFLVFDEDLTSAITPGTLLYNTKLPTNPTAINLTSSWREIPNTRTTGSGVGSAYAEIITSDSTKHIIYSFGGTSGTSNTNYIFFFSCSAKPGDALKLDVSPWYRQDANKNAWPGDVAANAFPSAGGTALTIPVAPGVKEGAACYDFSTNTLYFGGGIREVYVGSNTWISGSDDIFGWRVDETTGLITGSYFIAGKMPAGRYKHEMIAAGGFLYLIGGATGTSYHSHIDRALILNDGTVSNWEECLYEMPVGLDEDGVGAGLVDGAALIYPDNSNATYNAVRNIFLVGGLKQYLTSTSPGYVTRSSGQVYSAQLNFMQGASQLPDANKLNIDPSWQGPAQGEAATLGAQLGPNDIKPVLPLLDNIYQQLVIPTLPTGSQQFSENSKLVGYRPGLKGTEMNGTWTIKFATSPGQFSPNGDAGVDHWPSLTSSQVYFRQVRLEFLVDTTSGYSDIQYFNPARERLYRKSGVGLKNGRRLIDIISGSAWWDSGVSYIYSYVQPEYGRSAGITNSSASDDYAVFTQITGALSDYLSGTPNWYLNPPPGEGITGLPYIPLSSGSFGEASKPLLNTGSTADMMRATIDPQLPVPSDDTLTAYLSRIQAIRTTQDLFEKELLRQAQMTGSGG